MSEVREILEEIEKAIELGRPVNLMGVCGRTDLNEWEKSFLPRIQALLSTHVVICSKCAGDAKADIEFIYTHKDFDGCRAKENVNWIELDAELSRLQEQKK